MGYRRGKVTCHLEIPDGITVHMRGNRARKNLTVNGANVVDDERVQIGHGSHSITFDI